MYSKIVDTTAAFGMSPEEIEALSGREYIERFGPSMAHIGVFRDICKKYDNLEDTGAGFSETYFGVALKYLAGIRERVKAIKKIEYGCSDPSIVSALQLTEDQDLVEACNGVRDGATQWLQELIDDRDAVIEEEIAMPIKTLGDASPEDIATLEATVAITELRSMQLLCNVIYSAADVLPDSFKMFQEWATQQEPNLLSEDSQQRMQALQLLEKSMWEYVGQRGPGGPGKKDAKEIGQFMKRTLAAQSDNIVNLAAMKSACFREDGKAATIVPPKTVEMPPPVVVNNEAPVPTPNPDKSKNKATSKESDTATVDKAAQRAKETADKQARNELARDISTFNSKMRLDPDVAAKLSGFRNAIRYQNGDKRLNEYFNDAEANDLCALVYRLSRIDRNGLLAKIDQYDGLQARYDDIASRGVMRDGASKPYDLPGCIIKMRMGRDLSDMDNETWRHMLWAVANHFPSQDKGQDENYSLSGLQTVSDLYKLFGIDENHAEWVSFGELAKSEKPEEPILVIDHEPEITPEPEPAEPEQETKPKTQYEKLIDAIREEGGIETFRETDENGQAGTRQPIYGGLYNKNPQSRHDRRRCDMLDILVQSEIFDDYTIAEEEDRDDGKEKWMYVVCSIKGNGYLVLENVNYGNRTFVIDTARCGLGPKELLAEIKMSKGSFMDKLGSHARALRHPVDKKFTSEKYAEMVFDTIIEMTS